MAKSDDNQREFEDNIKVGDKRIAVVIGKKGSTKREIEERTGAKLTINSETGNVNIKAEDGLKLFTALNVVKAISRGFNPKVAIKLTSAEYQFDIIRITDYVSSKNALYRVRGRIIGTNGRSRKKIEELTDTNMVIFGKTVGIIGDYRGAKLAKEAITDLIEGSPHSTVFKWLEREHVKRSQDKLLEMYGANKDEI